MKSNVGGKDRAARYIIGGAGLAIAALAPIAPRWKLLSGIIGAIGLTTASTQYCPANALMHLDTCPPQEFDYETEHELTLNYR